MRHLCASLRWIVTVPGSGHPLLLSVDFEDWHQLVRRRVGDSAWQRPGGALRRQTVALLELFDSVAVQATFFVLGMAARAHGQLLELIVSQGHEVACHGDMHVPVSSQSPHEFADDIRAARQTIEELTGTAPVGYRAPAFSITRACPWAYDVLLEEGFSYDSSQHDSPRIRGRMAPASIGPHPIELRGGTVWELPPAVWRLRQGRLPVGGASYWALMPTLLVLRGLHEAGAMAGLYLHPHELDPQPLRAELAGGARSLQRTHAAVRELQRNLARRRAADMVRAIAERHPLISYGEGYARLAHRATAGT